MSENRRYKAIVIGSGAGGAPAAAALASRWGEGVALLEAGPHRRARDFTQVERDMVRQLYAGGGTQATEDGSVVLLGAGGVGGSTVVNDGVCFRPPPEMAGRWRARGAELEDGALDAHVAEVEAAMRVEDIPRSHVNRCNYLVGLGAARLGWRVERLRHNAPGCVQCGFRHIGCAYDRKQSMNLSYVPRAQAAGCALWADTRVERLSYEGGTWRLETGRGTFESEHVVISAGVMQSAALLLRSGLPAGTGFQPHLETYVWGEFDEPVDQHAGIPMSMGVLEFGDIYGQTGPGYLIEGCGLQAQAFSASLPLEGEAQAEVLGRYRHFAGLVLLLRTAARGEIKLGPGGRPAAHLPLIAEDASRVQHFYARAAELFLAAGARRVLLAHRGTPWVSRPEEALQIEPARQYLYSAHLFGGVCRGEALDGVGRVRGAERLWVLDASAFPEALGTNPQVTIAALSLQGAARILDGG